MQPYGESSEVAVPLCSIVEVNLRTGAVTFEVDACTTIIPNDLDEPRHTCLPD